MHEVWPSRAVGLLLNVNWVLLSEESWRGAPPVHIPLLRKPTARTFWTDYVELVSCDLIPQRQSVPQSTFTFDVKFTHQKMHFHSFKKKH